ncbi:MAG: dihydrolipoyl dehydrogenase [Candidatus Geothermarchaeales archaeon]
MSSSADTVVIGAGPGGYVAAIRLAQLGKETILVERDRLGGECLNYGCIPSKALIYVSKLVKKLEWGKEIGIHTEGLQIDFPKVQAWKESTVDRLVRGIRRLCEGNGVEVLRGSAKFRSAGELIVETAEGQEFIETQNAVIATGSRTVQLRGFPFDGETVIGSKDALELERVPDDLLVIGGGISGLEIGTLYAHLGASVTVVEMLDTLLPGTDRDIVSVITRALKRDGVTVHVSSTADGIDKHDGKAVVTVSTPGGRREIEVDKVLVTVGRRPNTVGLGLDEVGVDVDEQGFVRADDRMRTSVKGIYAIGDVTGQPFLAHRASKEGIVAAEVIAGLPSAADYAAVPAVIFTDPEIAIVGLSEAESKREGYRVSVGRFPFAASGRALTAGGGEGFVKVIAEEGTGRVLGVRMVGPDVSDLISEATLAIEMGATAEDIGLTIHPHPTLPESLMEAAEAVQKRAIHILNR